MTSSIKPKRVAELLLSTVNLELVSCTKLKTLWAGYGHICAVEAQKPGGKITQRLILKLISPPSRFGDEGHLRKMLSYEVEQYFYHEVAPLLGNDVAVAKCLVSTRHGLGGKFEELQGLVATLMTDLRPAFPVAGEKRVVLNERQIHAAIDWLAKFHANSWKVLPDALERFLLPPLNESRRRGGDPSAGGDKLWLNGGYTYLATRRREYASLAEDGDSEWSAAFCKPPRDTELSYAEMVANVLTPRGRSVETYIHGDVKSENLFTTESGDQVAFFDFQYAGLGLGVCDLAKLFTCSVPLDLLTACDSIPPELPMDLGEKRLLEDYLSNLLSSQPQDRKVVQYEWSEFVRHWETALVDWCRFQASWGFWGNTEWLESRVRFILADPGWQAWLQGELKSAESVSC